MLSLMFWHTHTHRPIAHGIRWSNTGQLELHGKQMFQQICVTREVIWNHPMVKNHLQKPPLQYSQFSFYIAWYLSRLSFHICNYGIFISWCMRPALTNAVGFTRADDAAIVKIHWPLEDVEQTNVGQSPVQLYQSEYYRQSRVKATLGSARHVCIPRSFEHNWVLLLRALHRFVLPHFTVTSFVKSDFSIHML